MFDSHVCCAEVEALHASSHSTGDSKADPMKYILSRLILSGRLAKWAIILEQYDLIYVPQKAIKWQVLADFLTDHPIPDEWR